ncbi:MAG TPA: leucine-rich repeat protein [Candidatus Limadaptatus stercoripullorum]|uniref:Leucine-rich repeat protein n=1 Tax=Candidatus Limadaptatus stercoripullorum TaxID=2840846 RepID=A0A9D1N9J5_9FIRM|nr:leucine-rich repeat protein [Candidatus Limadaptatus stercoripullorum]
MRRRIFVFLIALVLVALAATAFVACDPKGQTGTGGLLGEEQETFTEVVTPVRLAVLNPTNQMAQAFPADFSVSDITYQVVYKVETKSDLTGKTVSEAERRGELLTATADMLSAESLENLNHPGTHTVTLTLVVDGVSVSGATKVYLKDSAIPTHLVTVNYKVAGGEDKAVAKNIKEDSVLPYGASFLRKFGISSSYVDADGVTRYLAYFDIAGQDANFSPDDLTALTVTSPVTLTAFYSPEKKPSYTVTYVTEAPKDIIWSDGNAPADETSASVVQGGTVSEIRNNPEFRSDNYTLVGWVKEDGTAFNFASDRIYSDTEITAKWQKRTFKASVSLSGGSFDADYAASDLQGLSEVKAESVFDASGKLTGVTFTGIEYGRALSEFYASILLDKAGTAVLTVPLTVLFDAARSPLVRSGYELDGIYNGENAYTVGAEVTRALSLIAHWTPDTSSIDEDYFENTFEFEKLIDGTYAITRVKDARAALVYVPAVYKGLPVTRIEANAAKDNSSVTTLDLTAASNLTYIGANAFGGCVSLSDIRSDAATSKLSRIEAGAFDGINYDLRNNGHLIVGKVLVLAKTNGGEVVLSGEPFEYIAGGAFSDTNLTKLVLPDDLKGIADGAFAAANPTGEIAIVAHTTSMEYLGSDIGLASFSDGSEDNMLAIGNALYRYTGNDASVTLVNNGLDITVIAGGAFADSPSVTELVKTTADKDIVYIGEDAFHENFVAAHTDENGLFVYDGILVKYYGSAKQVTLTDEVRVINTGAFKNAGLSNLIIPSGSALKHVKTGAFRNAGGLNITVRAKESAADIGFAAEVSAFTNWNGAVYVEYRPDRNTSGTPGMSTQALYDSLVNDSAMWQWLEEEDKMFAVEVASVSLSTAKVPTVFVTGADGKVDFYASALGWGNNSRDTVFAEGDTYSIYDAVTARRNDGLTDTEDFVIKQSDLNAQFETLLGEPATEIAPDSAKTGIIAFTAKDSTIPADLIPASAPAGTLAVSVYPGIARIDILNAYGESTENVTLYTSYSDNIVDNFVLKDFTAVVTYTNGAVTKHVFSKSGTSITMAGYDQQPGSGTLVFSYTYAYPSSGLTSTCTAELAYTMQEPTPDELRLADDVAIDDEGRFHVALGAQVGGLDSQLRFTVGYTDGLTSETVVPGELLSITELSTDRYGEGVAKVTYKGEFAGEDSTIELRYFVDASPQSYFDFVFVDKNGAIVKNGDGPYYATDTDAFVLPEGYENYTVAVYWLREDTSAKRLAIPETIVAGGQTFAVTHIVNGAFGAAAGGNNIIYIYIPSSVVSIGARSFVDASSLRELDLRDARGLKFIGKEAFKGTTSLSSVDFTAATGLAAIGESAFQGSGLNNVTLGGVKKIEGSAFNGAAALVDIDLSGVTDIGAYAFEDCAALLKIDLTNLRTLGDNAFEGCTALSEIVTPVAGDFYGGNGGVLVAYGEVVAVSDTATDIVIPAGVTAIADYAFEGKDQVVTLSVAADFTLDLVDLAERFPLLESITVESGNSNYLSDAGALYNAAGTELLFIPVKYPGALVVREGVTALDSALFEGRTGINALTVPASVTAAEGVLSPLTALVSLTVPTVGATGAFCTWFGADAAAVPGTLTSVTVTGAVEAVDFAQFGANIEVTLNGLTYKNGVLVSVPEGTGAVVVIPGATGIAADAFKAPAGVKSVDIPASVTDIADGAFAGMTALTAITVAAENGAYSSTDGVLYDKAGTTLLLVPATKLSAPVIIADGVTRIAAGALGSDAVTVYSRRSIDQGSVTAEDTTVTVAYYSADDPYANGEAPEGVYWHEVEGKPVIWEKQPEVTE